MFLEHQPQKQVNNYIKLLKAVASLSNMFSESPEPYLASRSTENIFCKAFGAQNLSRSDASADALKNKIGFGIKTFLDKNGKSMQKIAEFNQDHSLFKNLPLRKKVTMIAKLRNARIETTKRIFELDNLIYHCITRRVGKVIVFELPVRIIDIKKIKNIKVRYRGNIVQFSDNFSEYSFNITKSTLYQRFITKDVLLEIPIKILTDPYSEIEKMITEKGLIFSSIKIQPHIFLPLYSTRGGVKNVPKKSGLNQWNALGRKRNKNEVYISVPSWIHKKFPNFFPSRYEKFELMLPNRQPLIAKLCQSGAKALMSNPNPALGEWLLRSVLNIKEGELVSYKKLQNIGLDTVVIYKIDNKHYDIDFTEIDSYEKFKLENR